MIKPYLLHIFNPTKNVSPFDVNMAYDAQFDGVIPYTEVTLEDIHALTQDVIFSRGKTNIQRTGIFIGGREFGLAIDMFRHAKNAMVPPFEVSIFADPSGAITTAAALISYVEKLLKQKSNETLLGKRIDIIGGTGPVGVCAGILAASCGAKVYLASRRGEKVAAEYAHEYNVRFNVKMYGSDCGTKTKMIDIVKKSDIVIGAAKAGIRLLSKSDMAHAKKLLIAADVNAVPPAGIEGIDVHDLGKELDFTPQRALGLGALAIGDLKYKLHALMFEKIKKTIKPIYFDHQQAFEIARVLRDSKENT